MRKLILFLLLIPLLSFGQDGIFKGFQSKNAPSATYSSKPEGWFYYNSVSGEWEMRDATGWFNPRSATGSFWGLTGTSVFTGNVKIDGGGFNLDIGADGLGTTINNLTLRGTGITSIFSSFNYGMAFDGTGAKLTTGTNAAGTLIGRDGSGYLQPISIGSSGQVLTVSGGLATWQTPAAAGVSSVLGTTNRITSTGGSTPVIDISSTFEALLGKVANPLSQFASTTSAQLRGVLSDELGTGAALFDGATPTSLVGTNITGTASGLTVGNVTTIPTLSGEVSNSGNAVTLSNSAVIGKVLTGFVSGAGTVAGTDNILQAIQKIDGNTNNTAVPLGTIINDDFNRGSLGSSYTATGGSYSIVSNQLEVVGGSSLLLTQRLEYNAYNNSNLDSYTIKFSIPSAPTPTATTYGIGPTIQSHGTVGQASVSFRLDMTNTANQGKIYLYSQNANQIAVSDNAMTISAGDDLRFTLKYTKTEALLTVLNNTTHKSNILYWNFFTQYKTTPVISVPNAFWYGIAAFGGTFLVDNLTVTGDDSKNADICVIGDSITKVFTDDNSQAWPNILMNSRNVRTVINSGVGNLIEDINLAEVIALAPAKIIIAIGVNNIQAGNSAATIATKYASMISTLNAGGYTMGTNLFITTILPSSTATNFTLIPTVNSDLFTNYTTSVIDTNTPSANGTSLRYSTVDGLHPSNRGHEIIASVVTNYFSLVNSRKISNDASPVSYNKNTGNVTLGDFTYRSFKPRYQLEVISGTQSQMRVGLNSVDDGMFLGSNGNASGYIGSGVAFDGSNYIAKNATTAMIIFSGSQMNFANTSGSTIGASVAATFTKMILNTTSLSMSNSTAVNFAAGTTTTYPAKFASGPLLTTPQAGAEEFLTDKRYFTITTGTARKEYTLNDAALTSGAYPIATTNGRLTDGVLTSSNIVTLTNSVALTNKSVNGVTLTTGGSTSSFLNANGTYSTPSSGVTNSAGNNVVAKSDGTNLVASAFSSTTAIPINYQNGSELFNVVHNTGNGQFTFEMGGTGSFSMSGGTGTVNSIIQVDGLTNLGSKNSLLIRSSDRTTNNQSSGDILFDIGTKNGSGTVGNMGFFTTSGSFGGGEKVLFIGNNTTSSTTTVSGGALLQVASGLIKTKEGDTNYRVGSIQGSFSQVGAATTVFTVTIGETMPSTSYKVNVSPTATLSAAFFYITNKTTTTFDVTYLAGLTGTVTFDWAVTP